MAPEIVRSEEEWKEQLTPEQYDILRRKGTEPPFTGKFTYNKDSGMYRCAACGADLFSSDTKYDSGSGWPSFTDPVNSANIELSEDRSHGMMRIEVICKRCGGHLGHLFDDGPGPNGKRFCINSCALDFDPMPAEGSVVKGPARDLNRTEGDL